MKKIEKYAVGTYTKEGLPLKVSIWKSNYDVIYERNVRFKTIEKGAAPMKGDTFFLCAEYDSEFFQDDGTEILGGLISHEAIDQFKYLSSKIIWTYL